MIEYLMLTIGLILLVKGADYLIDGSSFLAHKYGVSTLFIGLTVLAFGTSLPELVVNIIASLKNSGGLAFGNIIGSNMSNILLILGITTLITRINVSKTTIKKEIPFSILSVVLLLLFTINIINLSYTKELTRNAGLILIIFFAYFMYYVIRMAKKDRSSLEFFKIEKNKISNTKLNLMIFGGLIALYFGGKWTVDSAIIIARNIGMSEFFISATIIAIGTSLPELITSIIAARKKEINLLVGNIIGSNIFNILWVLGVTSIISPIPFSPGIILDLMILLFVSTLLFIFVWKKNAVTKTQGIIFIILYILYLIYLLYKG
jgi:cation:H+ antiporter